MVSIHTVAEKEDSIVKEKQNEIKVKESMVTAEHLENKRERHHGKFQSTKNHACNFNDECLKRYAIITLLWYESFL